MSSHKLKEAGLKVTLPRVKVLEAMESLVGSHVSAEDVYKLLLENKTDIGLATIYRILNQFEEVGILTRHNFDGAVARFELKSSNHHDHMICTNSGEIIEFTDPIIEARQKEIAREKGYELLGHSLVLHVKRTGSPA
ncbi:Fur family transcriptional regulator [Endozoicomonas montiporae]|uniref:Ferric uptake regulation protein n=2 Tax=Endozoicomonas montiporae TaxID=1027273 RepID=A0A081N0S4_9GAMM|nr:ferric iron uptake transcriptional regulator [Endozoicomonas montiporae]AMO54529.1 ferric uptake regulation protein [Endozoicomonas montiporae CL-33]KEQ12047.1 Fur family transcriptional regulator [Endozoicomonas montiporae]